MAGEPAPLPRRSGVPQVANMRSASVRILWKYSSQIRAYPFHQHMHRRIIQACMLRALAGPLRTKTRKAKPECEATGSWAQSYRKQTRPCATHKERRLDHAACHSP